MDTELRDICDLLVSSYEVLKEEDSGLETELLLAGVSMFVAEGIFPDKERLELVRELNKDGLFDDFNAKAEFFIRCKLALEDDPKQYIEDLTETCMFLKPGKAYTESNNIFASMILLDGADLSDASGFEELAQKAKDAYNILSGGKPKVYVTELPFAALAALEDRDAEVMNDNEKIAKEIIKKGIRLDNVTMKPVCRVMTLFGDDTASRCEELCSLSKTLKKAKRSVGQGRVNIILAFACALGLSEADLVALISETDDYIKQYKPFKGIMGVEPEIRRMFAMMSVVKRYDDQDSALARIVAIMIAYVSILNATRSF